jgi:spermidine/putrescine transport system permease protein
VTFPKYVYTAASRGIPAEANVVASAVFLIAIIGVIIAQVAAGIRRKRLARNG